MLGQISATKPVTPKWQHPNKPVERMTAVPAYDSKEDASEWWQQETDPENEIGEAAEAFFLHNQECDNSFFGDGVEHIESVELISLRVEDRGSVRIYTREGAAKYLGYGIVEQIEANHAEALNEY